MRKILNKIIMIFNLLKFKKEDEETMVAVYVTLIVSGRRTFDQVPKSLQEAVRADLAAMGLDVNGNPLEASVK